MTHYAELTADGGEVDVTAAASITGAHTVLLQHTAEQGRGTPPARWELRPDSALTDRLGAGHLMEPGDAPVSLTVPANQHLVAWRSSSAPGPAATLAVTVTG